MEIKTQTPDPAKTKTPFWIKVTAWTIMAFVFYKVVSCGSDDGSAKTQNVAKEVDSMTAAQKLCVLQYGKKLPVDAFDYKIMDGLLENLSNVYKCPADTIADYTYRTQGVLANDGITITLTKILNDMEEAAAPAAKLKMSYKDATLLYILSLQKK